ncbi:hypothetical protein E1B28_007379 [Marasmius oreades]|uniref:Uncharacterized protein n=1 Tax=Marasmius oreades TaxID=181124 RepID=A0A9P7S273_9AGAR|nr:uncharacterized protein E1B28_007379 [Marasmius oreades]KAG7093727.1 hypothetical protein E1B28_007379 [Marasmius oreades]
MGRALFSQAYAAPVIHEDNAYAAENPLEKAGYDRWSITNPFDPDSDEFFSNAQTERFLEPDELTEQQVLISSSVPPSDTDPDLLPPNAGSPVTNWVAVGPNMWARTVRRTNSLPSPPPVPSQMDLLESASSSGTTTPRSASPQTPDPVYSPTLPGFVPTEELLARLPPPATTTTITAATPSLTGTSPRRRRPTNPQGESLSPPLSVSPRLYTWSRSRPEEDELQSTTLRRIRPRIDSGSTSATPSMRSVRRSRTRSLGPVHQHPESLMPGAGSWHERSSYQRLSSVNADTGHSSTNRDESGGSANSRISRLLSGIEDDNAVALVRRLLERSDRTREYARDRVGDLDNHIERLARERERILSAHLQDMVAREDLLRRSADTALEEETEPFIPEPDGLRFVAL